MSFFNCIAFLTTMINEAIDKLAAIVIAYPERFQSIPAEKFSCKPSPQKWSKKEILGHLIDSATNNHQRFIRAQFEDRPEIYYDQDMWVQFNHYNDMPLNQLIHFWTVYNLQLIEVIKRIPVENLILECKMRDGNYLTLDYLVNDYVQHMEHHIRQIFD